MRPSFRVLLHDRRSSHDPVHIYRPFDIEASVGPLGDAEEAGFVCAFLSKKR